MKEGCIFCKWSTDGQSDNIWENEFFISRFDSFPVSPGHALIIPRRHVVDLSDLDVKEWRLLQQSIRDVIGVIVDTDLKQAYQRILNNPLSETSSWFCRNAMQHPRINTKPDAYNYGINDGLAAGRTVNHLHLHVIPRFEGDMDDPTGGVRYVIPKMGNYRITR